MSAQRIEVGDLVCYRQGRGMAEGRVSMIDHDAGILFVRRPKSGVSIRKQIGEVTFVAGPSGEKPPS